LNGKEVTTAKEYDEAISEGIKASNVASAIVEEITDDAETEIDETELNEYLDGIKDPIKEMAESNDTDFETIISYYYGFSTEEEFDEYYADIFRNYIILIAIAKEEGVEITEDEYNKVAQSMVDHSNGSYANIKEYQADYDKQTTVDDLICGKVYYILADSVEVVPDSEIETTTEETVEDTTEETEAAE
jgi:trigger factor